MSCLLITNPPLQQIGVECLQMTYSKKLLDHFENPRCVGEIPDADAVGEVTNPVCGDVLKIWIKLTDNRVTDAKFKAQGCTAAIATSSFATEMILGMDIAQARRITRDEIVDALGGLPPSKIHCSVLASDAIQQALRGL